MSTSFADPSRLRAGVSREFLLRHRVCPARFGPDGSLELGQFYQRETQTEFVEPGILEQQIETLVNRTERSLQVERLSDENDDRLADLRELSSQPPVIRYVNLLLREAYDARASDVHLEATRGGLIARFRLDGALVAAPEPPRQMQQAVVSRLKAIAELDIAERRRPQDGRIRVRLAERELDLRVSTVPTVHGESVVLRLLDRGGKPVGLADLGMRAETQSEFERLIARPNGMLLVTGPTGGGKTTTLYAALQLRDSTSEKIITVEDPVEYELAGITQVPVHRQAGVTFATALRSILRQDPDVVMVGEMRDQETAEIAVQAAMTGHLVLSTLHTNDAVGTIPRLLDLGIPDYLISGTLEGVLAQRLVRRICAGCAVSEPGSAALLMSLAGREIEPMIVRRGTGCAACRGTGFLGRTGLFELLVFTDPIRAAISRRCTVGALRQLAVEQGMTPLREHGIALVREGITTVDEVLRVVQV